MILLYLLLAVTTVAQEYCNQETAHSCACPSCWDDLPLTGAIDWITVETGGCGPIDEKGLRTKLASWSTEECGSSVHCGIQLPITAEQILLGRLSCDPATHIGAISLALLTGPGRNGDLSQDSLLPAHLLGAILHSREHLLAIALRAHLTTVQITQRATIVRRTSTTPRTTTTTPRTTPRPTTTTPTTVTTTPAVVVQIEEQPRLLIPTSSIGITLAVGCFALAILALVIYAVWGRIEWKRLVEGRWKRRVYRKVPDVMFRSADEMPTVIPHSTSSHSTAHLIRY